MPTFEMSFAFERGAVRLADGSFFVPMQQATERWVAPLISEHTALVGRSFEILYRLTDLRFVFGRYECCQPLYPDRDVRHNFWASSEPPRVQVITDEQAANWLVQRQLLIPDDLLALLSRPETKPAPRPFSFWVAEGLPGHDVPMLAHEIDRIAVTKNLHQQLVRAIQGLRDARDATAFSAGALDTVGRLLFDRYVVTVGKWWGPDDSLPPARVTITDLNWAKTEEAIVLLRRLCELLHAPLACQAATRMFGTVMVPNDEERQIGWEALRVALPEIEELTIELGRALKHVEAEPSPEPQKAKKPTPKRGSRAANIEKLEKELIEHIMAARSYAIETKGETGVPELLPRPLQKKLAERCQISESDVTRCFQDSPQLRKLYEIAGDVDDVLLYGRRTTRG
jgi:hypothetical protein